mmetsp:Transcript_9926/g.20121  ORF Transcript_9926/g.20121 Transcript_9926/m.20121 type:complete len:269 (-) Transcript_9926:1587-2393(-)
MLGLELLNLRSLLVDLRLLLLDLLLEFRDLLLVLFDLLQQLGVVLLLVILCVLLELLGEPPQLLLLLLDVAGERLGALVILVPQLLLLCDGLLEGADLGPLRPVLVLQLFVFIPRLLEGGVGVLTDVRHERPGVGADGQVAILQLPVITGGCEVALVHLRDALAVLHGDELVLADGLGGRQTLPLRPLVVAEEVEDYVLLDIEDREGSLDTLHIERPDVVARPGAHVEEGELVGPALRLLAEPLHDHHVGFVVEYERRQGQGLDCDLD